MFFISLFQILEYEKCIGFNNDRFVFWLVKKGEVANEDRKVQKPYVISEENKNREKP